jgi:hypothetical protein
MRSVGVLCVAAYAVTVAQAAVPLTRTYNATGLGLSLALPSDWGAGATGVTSGAGPRFEGVGPASTGTLIVYTMRGAAPLSSVASAAEATIRLRYTAADPHASITTERTTIGSSLPAVKITASYHGLWADGVGEITHVVYFFESAGVVYEFDFMAVAPFTAKYLPAFQRELDPLPQNRVDDQAWTENEGSVLGVVESGVKVARAADRPVPRQ